MEIHGGWKRRNTRKRSKDKKRGEKEREDKERKKTGEEAQNTGRVTGGGKRKRGKTKRIEKGRNSERMICWWGQDEDGYEEERK